MGQCIQPMQVRERQDGFSNGDVLDWSNDPLVGRKSAENSRYNSKTRLGRSQDLSRRGQQAQSGILSERSLKRSSISFAEDLEQTICEESGEQQLAGYLQQSFRVLQKQGDDEN